MCFRLLPEGFCSPIPKFLKCSQNLWPSFSCLKKKFSNEKVWCLETKLWSKVILFQRVYGYAETPAWFAHVTDCYYFGKRNSNKFFLTTKFIFVQSHPYWWGNFEQLWCSLFDRNTCAMNWLFLHLEKRSYSDF